MPARDQRNGRRTRRRSGDSRYSLKTVGVVFAVLALLLGIIANSQMDSAEPAASPVVVALVPLGILLFAVVSEIVCGARVALVAVFCAGSGWMALIFFIARSDERLAAQQPLHLLAVASALLVITWLTFKRPQHPSHTSRDTIRRLKDVKWSVREARLDRGNREVPPTTD